MVHRVIIWEVVGGGALHVVRDKIEQVFCTKEKMAADRGIVLEKFSFDATFFV